LRGAARAGPAASVPSAPAPPRQPPMPARHAFGAPAGRFKAASPKVFCRTRMSHTRAAARKCIRRSASIIIRPLMPTDARTLLPRYAWPSAPWSLRSKVLPAHSEEQYCRCVSVATGGMLPLPPTTKVAIRDSMTNYAATRYVTPEYATAPAAHEDASTPRHNARRSAHALRERHRLLSGRL